MNDIDNIFEDWDDDETNYTTNVSVDFLKENDRISVKYNYNGYYVDFEGEFIKHFKSALGNEYLIIQTPHTGDAHHLNLKGIENIDLI